MRDRLVAAGAQGLDHGVGHARRAIAPTIPAAAAVLAVRALAGHDSAGLAVAELLLYVAITALATWRLEGPLLREVLGYLRGGVSISRT